MLLKAKCFLKFFSIDISYLIYVWSWELVNFNSERTQEQWGLTFVTRVYWTWTMCAQWAGKLMTAYIWGLYTCGVKDVTPLLGIVEHWWLKKKRTKGLLLNSKQPTKYGIFDSSTTSTHLTGIFRFCTLCLLTGWVCPGEDILSPVLVASHFFPNRISKGLVMWGEQNQQSQWHVALFSAGEDLSVCMCWRQISPVTIWYKECTPAEMWVTPASFNFGLFLSNLALSTVAWGTSRWHCAAVCEMSPRTVMLRFCLCEQLGLSVCYVLRGIWMPHFTLMQSLFFGYFCFSQPIVLRENGTLVSQ